MLSVDGGGRTGAVRSRRGMAATRPVDEVASTGTRAEADEADEEAAMGCGVGRRFIFGVSDFLVAIHVTCGGGESKSVCTAAVNAGAMRRSAGNRAEKLRN